LLQIQLSARRYGFAKELSPRSARLGDHPAYVAGYFQYGQLLAQAGRTDEAKRIFSAGVVVAQKPADSHARDEIQAALSALTGQ